MCLSSVNWGELGIYIKKKFHAEGCAADADTADVCCTLMTDPHFRSGFLTLHSQQPKFLLQIEPYCNSVLTSFRDKVASV